MHTVLRHPRFARLLAALAVSQLGDWLYNLALLAYVDSRAGSPAWLGATTAARVAPIVVAGPLGGVIADRFDRRRVMLASDLIRAGLMGLLVVVAVAGLPLIFAPVLAGLATLAAAPYPSCVAATTVRLVDEADRPAANAARATLTPACVVAGPALGAVLLLLGPPTVAFAVNGLTFCLSALLVLSVRSRAAFRPDAGGAARESATVRADLRAGAAALIRWPDARRLVGADVVCSLVYGAQTVLLLLVAQRLGRGADGYGALLAAYGAGGIAGAVAGGRIAAAPHRSATLALALLAVALPLPMVALGTGFAVALALTTVVGAGCVVVEVLAETGLQRALPEAVFGRAYGFAYSTALSGIVAGSLVAPLLVAVAGVDGALTILGIGVALAAAALARPARARLPRAAVAEAL